MKKEKEDFTDLKRSFNYYKDECRLKKIHTKTGISKSHFIGIDSALRLSTTFFEKSNYQFELHPYKPYFLFRLIWMVRSLMDKIKVVKIKKFKAWSLLEKIGLVLTIIVSLIGIYEFIIKPNIK